MNMDKLSSTAGKLDVFFKVLQRIVGICMIVVLCVLAVLTIVNTVDPEAVIGTELSVLKLGPVAIELAEEHAPDNSTILGYAWVYAVLGVICAAAVHVGLGDIRKILRPMAEGSPFHPDTSRYIRRLAVLSLVLGVIQNIASVVEGVTALRSFRLDQLMESGAIRSVTVNYTLQVGFIVVFFVLLLMSYIFSYGTELQKLSDETL